MSRKLHGRMILLLAGLAIAVPAESIAQRYRGGGQGGAGWNGGGGGGGQYRGYRGGYRRGGYDGGYRGGYGYARAPVYGRYYGRGYGGYGRPYGYAAYPPYYRYPGYYGGYGGYYGHHHHDGGWIAVGAGLIGALIGSAIAQPRIRNEQYPVEAEPALPPEPQWQRCPDGSAVPLGSSCPMPQAPLPPPPAGERG